MFYIKVSQEKSNEILKLITTELSQAAQGFTDKINSSLEQIKPKNFSQNSRNTLIYTGSNKKKNRAQLPTPTLLNQ